MSGRWPHLSCSMDALCSPNMLALRQSTFNRPTGHYLEVLKTKPGALPGSTALARVRESGIFTSAHEAFWAASRRVNGDADETGGLIDVLPLHRSLESPLMSMRGSPLRWEWGAVSADIVAVEARRHAWRSPSGGSSPDPHPGAHAEAKLQATTKLTVLP